MTDTGWDQYLRQFHSGSTAGITERLLLESDYDGLNPYEWARLLLPTEPDVLLDLACGSAPLAETAASWIGLDRSQGELATAVTLGRRPLLRASATAVPLRSGSVDAVLCSMSMQVIEPLDAALGEIARLLKPSGGFAVLTMPTGWPLGWRDAVAYIRLMLALRQPIRYPNDRELGRRNLHITVQRNGLEVVSDERKGFRLPLRSASDVERLVDSLYLPGVDPRRLPVARATLASRIGSSITIPIRAVTLSPSSQAPPPRLRRDR